MAKPKFNPNDRIIELATGDEWVVISWHMSYTPYGNEERYEIMHFNTGHTRTLHHINIDMFELASVVAANKLPSGKSLGGFPYLDDVGALHDAVYIRDPGLIDALMNSQECQHEWVTWTGLHGTQTDCSKCKQVKKDA